MEGRDCQGKNKGSKGVKTSQTMTILYYYIFPKPSQTPEQFFNRLTCTRDMPRITLQIVCQDLAVDHRTVLGNRAYTMDSCRKGLVRRGTDEGNISRG